MEQLERTKIAVPIKRNGGNLSFQFSSKQSRGRGPSAFRCRLKGPVLRLGACSVKMSLYFLLRTQGVFSYDEISLIFSLVTGDITPPHTALGGLQIP